jgi:outer membrane protein OmpA-like peptidoglycan-associated protein
MKKLTKNQKITIGVVGFLALIGIGYLILKKRKPKQEPKPIKQKLKDVFDNLVFEFNKDVIKPTSYNYLDELADVMVQEPTWKLQIIGHTDNKGSEEYNLDLSTRRANSVKKYLISKGVNQDIITSEGKGETEPIDTNDTEQGREKNRRVEFIIIKPDNTIVTTEASSEGVEVTEGNIEDLQQ